MSRNTENFVDLHTGYSDKQYSLYRESIRSKSILALYQYLYCRGRGWIRVMNRREKAEGKERVSRFKNTLDSIDGIKSNQTHITLHTIYIYTLLVFLYPINVETAKPIGPKFCMGSRMTRGKVNGWSNFQKFVSNKIRFLKILKIHDFFLKSAKFLFYNV